MNKTIKTIALLKTLYERSNSDYIELFIPFIATLILNKKYSEITIEKICNDFNDEYGIKIPYHPMQTILRRAKTRSLIKKSADKWFPIEDNLLKYNISTKTIEQTSEIDQLINNFMEFSQIKYGKPFTFQDAENILISFLKDNDKEILFAFENVSLLPDVDAKKEQIFILNKYIKYLYENNYSNYKLLSKFVTGFVFASCIFYSESTHYKGNIRNVKIFLDTRIILRLVGLEGQYRRTCYEEFMKLLKARGAKLYIFEHTYDETIGIINDCEKWIRNKRYNPILASPVLKHFIENNFSEVEVSLFSSKVNTRLAFEDITKQEDFSFKELTQYQIDNQKLHDLIVEVYSKSKNFYEDPSKEEVIYRDVKSIAAIYKLRKGTKPRFIKDAKAIFLTTNSSLAKANALYNKQEQNGYYQIRECLTDVFLGTILWVESPNEISEMQEKKIIANCIAAIKPDDDLIKKFVNEIKKLESDNLLTENELYFLKTHKLVNELLSEKTLGDSDNFYDKLPEEILDEIKNFIRQESDKVLDNEIIAHEDTKERLIDTKNELVASEIDNIRTKENIKKFVENVSKWTVRLIFGITFPIVLIVFVLANYQSISDDIVKIIVVIVSATICVLSGYFGISVKWILEKLKNRIEHWLLKLFE